MADAEDTRTGAQAPNENPDSGAPEEQAPTDGGTYAPPKRRKKNQGSDEPASYQYRVEFGLAVVLILFALVCDLLNIIPLVGIITKVFITFALFGVGINPFRVWIRPKTAARRSGEKEKEVDDKADDLEKKDTKMGGLWKVLNLIFGLGPIGWVVTLVLDSLPVLSVGLWTTFNMLLIISQSRADDRNRQRHEHLLALMAKDDAADATWKSRLARVVRARMGPGRRQQGGGQTGTDTGAGSPPGGAQRTRSERYPGRAGKLTPEQLSPGSRNDAKKGSGKSGRMGLGPGKQGAAPLGKDGKPTPGTGSGGTPLVDGIAAGTTAAGLAEQTEDEKAKTDFEKNNPPGVDGVIPEGELGQEPIDPNDLGDLEGVDADDLIDAWNEYQVEGGTRGFDEYIRNLSPRQLAELKDRGSTRAGAFTTAGLQGIDGVAGGRTAAVGGTAASTKQSAIRSKYEEQVGGRIPDDQDYYAVQKDIQGTIEEAELKTILQGDISPETEETLKSIRAGRMAGTLSDDNVEILKREIEDPKLADKIISLRGKHPAMGLDVHMVRAIANNPSLGSDIRLTAEDMAAGIPGAALSAQQMKAIQASASLDAAVKSKVAGLNAEHVASNVRAVDMKRRVGEWMQKSNTLFDDLIQKKITEFETLKKGNIIANQHLRRDGEEMIRGVLKQVEAESGLVLDRRINALAESIKSRIAGKTFASKGELGNALRDAVREEAGRA